MTTAPLTGSRPYADRYAAISARLLREAQAELDAGDLLPASEKAWGATAHAVKSVAEKWGWYHQGHYRLNAAVDFITYYRGREDLGSLFLAPTIMHFNYSERELAEDKLQTAINSTKTFVEEMEKIRAEAIPDFPPPDRLSRIQARRLRLLTTEPKDMCRDPTTHPYCPRSIRSRRKAGNDKPRLSAASSARCHWRGERHKITGGLPFSSFRSL